MQCPYFQQVPVEKCNAFLRGIKIPIQEEQEQYCRTNKCKECTTFIRKTKDLNQFDG
jgi:hypothetical protein